MSFPRNNVKIDSWPGGARVAVAVVLNVECFDNDQAAAIQPGLAAHPPDLANRGWRDYGNACGLPRLLEMLARHHVPFSLSMNADVPDREPATWETLQRVQSMWSLAGHGLSNTRLLPNSEGAEAEAAYIKETLAILKRSTGLHPRSWLCPNFCRSEHTATELARAGIECSLDFLDSDFVSRLETPAGNLLIAPYTMIANDYTMVLVRQQSPVVFAGIISEHIAQLAEEPGPPRMTSISLHTFLTGQPAYARPFGRLLEELAKNPRVWLTNHDRLLDFVGGL